MVCTRMLEAGVPFPVLAVLMGWSPAPTVRMAKRYGHIGQKAVRTVVEAISSPAQSAPPRMQKTRRGRLAGPPAGRRRIMKARSLLMSGLALLSAGCTVGPKYAKPTVPVPPAFKEPLPDSFKETKDWKFAQPGVPLLPAKRWETFADPQLTALERTSGGGKPGFENRRSPFSGSALHDTLQPRV